MRFLLNATASFLSDILLPNEEERSAEFFFELFAQLFHFVVGRVVSRTRCRREDHDGDVFG